MQQILAIAAGGALGALMRYGLANGVHAVLGRGFPYGTLTVNVVGSLLLGIVYIVFLERLLINDSWRLALQVGVLGAFTTFSTFSLETLLLIENGEPYKALLNVVLSVLFCLLAAAIGMLIGRQL